MLNLRTFLLMLFAISTVAGCGEQSTGHVEDKTPGGAATPGVTDGKPMSNEEMDKYSAEAAAKAAGGAAPAP